MEKYSTHLPTQYENWLLFYRDIKKNNLGDSIEVVINVYPDPKRYLYTIEYIKSMCFDEIENNHLNIDDLRHIEMCLYTSLDRSELSLKVIDKVRKTIDHKYDLGEY